MLESTEALFQAKPKLLVVDDESSIRRHLHSLAETLGFEVFTAGDGVEGWQTFVSERPDLVVLDIYMPRMNGLALLSKIKGETPECPVILITGFLNYEQLIKTGGNMPDGCIVKPLNLKKTGDLLMRMARQVMGEAVGEPA
jgi:DNA-binding NtrC family response regulator